MSKRVQTIYVPSVGQVTFKALTRSQMTSVRRQERAGADAVDLILRRALVEPREVYGFGPREQVAAEIAERSWPKAEV